MDRGETGRHHYQGQRGRGGGTPVRAMVELWRLDIAPEEIPNRLPHLTLGKCLMR